MKLSVLINNDRTFDFAGSVNIAKLFKVPYTDLTWTAKVNINVDSALLNSSGFIGGGARGIVRSIAPDIMEQCPGC